MDPYIRTKFQHCKFTYASMPFCFRIIPFAIRSISRATLVVFVLGNIGCAFTSETIALQYTPPETMSVAPITRTKPVKVTIQDSRADKSKVSSKKNGYGMETAPIQSSTSIPELISDAFTMELSKRGIISTESAANKHIIIDIVRFYNDFKIGFFSGDAVAELHMAISVHNAATQVLYSRQITATGTEPNTFLASGSNAQLALNKALAEGMKTLFSDSQFLECLNK